MEDNSTNQQVPQGTHEVNRCVVVPTSALTFPCPYPNCEKAQAGNHFQDKSRWQQHIRMHNGTAPRCPICRSMDANLRRHIRKHRKEGPVRAPIVATDAEINTMKGGVIRATMDAANESYKGLKTDAELRRRLIAHKKMYNAYLVQAMMRVVNDIAPHYQFQQDPMKQYLNREFAKEGTTVGSVMIQLMEMTGAETTARDEKKLLKRLNKKLVTILPSPTGPPKPSFFKAVQADNTGRLFRIDTNNDGQPDTWVKVVDPPNIKEGRWASTLKKRRLGAMKEEQLDVSAVLSSKDLEIQTLRNQLRAQQVPIRPFGIDLDSLPPPIFPLDSPALQFAATSQPIPLPPPKDHRPPSPRWKILEREDLYDLALINMLKTLGFNTEKKYWKRVTTDMINKYESQSGPLKPGVKIKFLDMYGKPWAEGNKVEVEFNGTWMAGEVVRITDDAATVMSKSTVSPSQIVQVPREEMIGRIREPTQLTATKDRYEKLIEKWKRRAGRISSDETDSSPETDRAMSSSPMQMNNEDTTVKEEPPDREFDWHSLSDLTLGLRTPSSFPNIQMDWPAYEEPPWQPMSDLGSLCLPRIDTDEPWNSTAQAEAGRMPAIGTYIQSGPNALRNVLPLIPKFMGPRIAKKPTDVEQIPEPPQMFTG